MPAVRARNNLTKVIIRHFIVDFINFKVIMILTSSDNAEETGYISEEG